jgi:hypothetical protein
MQLEWLKQGWLRQFLNAVFVNRFRREIMAVVWPCKVNG